MVVAACTLALAVIATSCSSAPAPQPKEQKVASAHKPPKDLPGKFPSEGQTGMQLVPDHLLGKEFMPGGNLADYKTAPGTYQIFLLQAPDAQAAAFLLLDWKSAMPDATYLAHMGGYFGHDQGKALYIFAKGPYLAGIVGLAQEKADLEARKFAAHL
jgi:hypothetical protein